MARIRFVTDNKEVEVPDGTSILKACEEHKASLPFGCTEGFCGTCTMHVIEGAENLSPPTSKERERLSDFALKHEAKRLGCQSSILKGTLVFENA
ncbi:MAG: 2Fe-2S iron-sulfur cluster-binding protein [Bdellovibrionota bacterium]